MGAIGGVRLLLSAADVAARRFDYSFSNLQADIGGGTASINGLRLAALEIEIASVGVLSLFEARMQRQFPNGPFFKQLKAHLISVGQAELANDVWHYYLAVNVLKHGQGSSYRELCNISGLPFSVKQMGGGFF